MKIYPFEEFHYKTFGGPPNQADWTCEWRITGQPRNPVSVSSFVILGEVARMCRCATRSSCSST